MKPTAAHLKQKAQGFVLAIEKMSDAAKQQNPSAQYGNDYNGLVRMVQAASPELMNVLPPEAEIATSGFTGDKFCVQKYDEICAYCQQIIQLLP